MDKAGPGGPLSCGSKMTLSFKTQQNTKFRWSMVMDSDHLDPIGLMGGHACFELVGRGRVSCSLSPTPSGGFSERPASDCHVLRCRAEMDRRGLKIL